MLFFMMSGSVIKYMKTTQREKDEEEEGRACVSVKGLVGRDKNGQ